MIYIDRKVPSGQKKGSSAEYVTPINSAPDLTDDIAGQRVDNGVGSSAYYDYIPPLNPVPDSLLPQSSSTPPFTTDTVKMNSNYSMTENYSYNRVPCNSSDQKKPANTNASNSQTLLSPPLPPRNARHAVDQRGIESSDLETEDSEGYMRMLPGVATTDVDMLPAAGSKPSVEYEETIDYI